MTTMPTEDTGTISYGPDAPSEQELRLLGDLKGKRVLELGCGRGAAAIAFAGQGASVIAIDASRAHLTEARRTAERAEVRVEWHEGDIADLAFLRADSIDTVFSAHTIGEVEDVGRVFRQVHRVLRPQAAFVFSYEHPLALCVAREVPVGPGASASPPPPELPLGRPELRRSYFDDASVTVDVDGDMVTLYPRTLSSVFMGLTRAGFRVEVFAEPVPVASFELEPLVPPTVVWRARKEGA
jgi:SAM-dependent methyltransferase